MHSVTRMFLYICHLGEKDFLFVKYSTAIFEFHVICRLFRVHVRVHRCRIRAHMYYLYLARFRSRDGVTYDFVCRNKQALLYIF